MESDTPRTDAAERECACTVNGAIVNGVVTAWFARQLERDLAAANEKGENLHAKYRETEAALIAARREIADARNAALEAAAKVCDQRSVAHPYVHAIAKQSLEDAAEKIRALKSPAQGETPADLDKP